MLPGIIAVPGQTSISSEDEPGRIPILPSERDSALSAVMESTAWNDLRQAWAAMTAVAQPDSDYWYPGVIEIERADSLRSTIVASFDELMTRGSPAMGEISVMRRLCMLRIQGLLYGSRSMMTRMIMPPVTEDAEKSIYSFEKRLDAIEELRSRGLMNAGECYDAFQAAMETAMASLILDTLSTRRLYFSSYTGITPEPSWELVQLRLDELRAFSDTASSIRPELYQQALEMLSSADSIRSLLPGIGVLLTDLICAR